MKNYKVEYITSINMLGGGEFMRLKDAKKEYDFLAFTAKKQWLESNITTTLVLYDLEGNILKKVEYKGDRDD